MVMKDPTDSNFETIQQERLERNDDPDDADGAAINYVQIDNDFVLQRMALRVQNPLQRKCLIH